MNQRERKHLLAGLLSVGLAGVAGVGGALAQDGGDGGPASGAASAPAGGAPGTSAVGPGGRGAPEDEPGGTWGIDIFGTLTLGGSGPDGGRLGPGGPVAGPVRDPKPIELPTRELFRASTGPSFDLKLPGLSGFAPQGDGKPLATAALGQVTLAAQLTEEGEAIGQGLIWRVFGPEPDGSGKLPLVASAQGGTSVLQLAPGSYLVHASFGRAGATKRIKVGREPRKETLVLDAGGLKLDAVIADGSRIDPEKLKFSIYEGEELDGERPLIIPDVSPGAVVRLKSGVYHIVSTYGAVNAVIRSDIRVEAGKLTEATVEHRAAELTLKLVRESGGEAMADTAWSVLTDAGDIVRESVGPYFEMVLAEGDYTVVAKNRDRIYRRDFTVTAGQNAEIEVIANEASAKSDRDILD